MILMTGATGVVGGELLPLLLASGHDVRVLVREPRRLGPDRVNVQISLGDLADPFSMRHAMRGVETVIHLAATIRDQPGGSIEELNGLATARLLRSAERAGVERFVFFSAIGATDFQRTRFFRAKALAEHAVREAPLETTVFAPSIVYAPGDPWITLLRRFSSLPAIPVSGSGRARYQPIWARDVARCVAASLEDGAADAGTANGARPPGPRFELAGPQTLSYDGIVEQVLEASGRERPLVHVPVPLVRAGLRGLQLLSGPSVFATWEEAELMEVPMTTERGPADAKRFGVEPRAMADVLGA
ncbi:MAG: NAD-dependent epimerase/dehydratase family protein [Actinobacteria bacterium]|nr:NAD-dependent epimerase/dehydratase family protein [Actinomycetota bacterium]